MKGKKAFTLVELIVVITILVVLGTIAFLSFQSYTLYARDSVRLSNLRNIESGLQIQYTKGGNYAVPDNFVSITASGTLIRQQGVFGPNSLRTIQANTDASKDPLTEQYYDYVTDAYQSEYQLIGYMEGEEVNNNNYLPQTFASTGTTMRTMGQDLGIVSKDGVDLHRDPTNLGQNFDIRNNSNQEYTIRFDQTDEITSTSGSLLFSNVYNRSKALLNNKELAKLDDTLALYFDMETTTMSGSLKVLKDWSKYGNHGFCIRGGSHSINCGGSGAPLVEKGRGMLFHGLTGSNAHGVTVPGFDLSHTDEITVFVDYNIDNPINYDSSLAAVILLESNENFNDYATYGTGFVLSAFDRSNGNFTYVSTRCSMRGENYYNISGESEDTISSTKDQSVLCTFSTKRSLNESRIMTNSSPHFIDNFPLYNYDNIGNFNTNNLYIGGRHGSSYPIKGNIKQIRIYDRELSGNENMLLYSTVFD